MDTQKDLQIYTRVTMESAAVGSNLTPEHYLEGRGT